MSVHHIKALANPFHRLIKPISTRQISQFTGFLNWRLPLNSWSGTVLCQQAKISLPELEGIQPWRRRRTPLYRKYVRGMFLTASGNKHYVVHWSYVGSAAWRRKTLTHAISTRPARPTLGAVPATNKEVIPGAPCPIVTALTVLKHTAAWKKESGNKLTVMQKSGWKTATARTQSAITTTSNSVACQNWQSKTFQFASPNFTRALLCSI